MHQGSCHCGAVKLRLPSTPSVATSCNCSICRRVGGPWVYFEFGTVGIEGHPENTAEYIQGDRTLRTIRCRTCGCVTHWEPLDPQPGAQHGVHLGNFDPAFTASVKVRRFDGADTWKFLDELPLNHEPPPQNEAWPLAHPEQAHQDSRSTPFHLEPLSNRHFEQLHALFDAVCREKRFLAFTRGGPPAEAFAYYQGILDRAETHFVAIDHDVVIGWCDVLRQSTHVRQHVGTMGMAVASSHRGRGVGRALINRAVEHARGRGLSRIELTVHTENTVAQQLYASVGFVREGTQRQAWLMDGTYFDVHFMAHLGAA